MNNQDGELTYLYGFVPRAAPAPRLLGIAGAAVELEDVGGLLAAVSQVPAAIYGERAIAERLGDVRWAAELGALHERVVSWFVDNGGILPARLLTIYTSTESLRSAVAPRATALVAELHRFESLREWNLKVAYDDAVLRKRLGEVSQAVAALDAEAAEAPPGRRYLLEKKRSGLVQSETAAAAARLAADLLRQLSTSAAEIKRLPLGGGGSTIAAERGPGGLPVTLNAALLVPAGAEEALVAIARERAEQLESLGLVINFSGPWAPYRFVSVAEESETDAAGA